MEGRLPALLDGLVADGEARVLPAVTPRHARLAQAPGKADVVVGMRRSGKTYRLFQHVLELEARGVPRTRVFYLSFEDERLWPLQASDLARVPDAFYRRHPDTRDVEHWFLFDEIQSVPGWDRFVRRLLDTERARIVLTGSSSKLLAREIATTLRGRSLAVELLPFGFSEALEHAGVEVPSRWPPPARMRSALEHAFERFLTTGGFPEVQSMEEALRARVLQDYVDVVLFRDVVERHAVGNVVALRHLVRRLVRSPAALVSVHRLHAELRSQGVQVGKDALHEYLAHLEDAFLLFLVPVDTRSEARRLVNPRKCYLADHALARAASFPREAETGRYLENIVYLELRRRGDSVAYHVTDSGHEVDFLVRDRNGEVRLLQCCASLAAPGTRARELGALEEALGETGARHAEIVTLHDEESVRVGRRIVRVVPAWRWLLEETVAAGPARGRPSPA